MARKVKVLLTKTWSDWGEGDVVELEAAKAGRVIAKGFGVKATPKAIKEAARNPVVETADGSAATENADARPQIVPDSDQGPEADDGGDTETDDD